MGILAHEEMIPARGMATAEKVLILMVSEAEVLVRDLRQDLERGRVLKGVIDLWVLDRI